MLVTFTPAEGPASHTTAEAGGFSMTLPQGSEGVLHASLAAPAPGTAAALTALRLALGLTSGSPAALIAADVTGDGRVTVEDTLAILRSALGLPGSAAPRWVFLPSEALADPAPLAPGPSGLSLSLQADTSIALTGILVGHPDLLV